ncbi:hypothetical protein C8R46DRAFT_1213936 [Mycena filopes]|nr:hypothetical protein C8R46DRAFT_1232145 [Mycena filopes]KAJ7175469.1 hypothetical protein C8R46DRAFT_1213936 [Mycena filopes]
MPWCLCSRYSRSFVGWRGLGILSRQDCSRGGLLSELLASGAVFDVSEVARLGGRSGLVPDLVSQLFRFVLGGFDWLVVPPSPSGGGLYVPLASIGLAPVVITGADAYSVSPYGGWVLVISPTRKRVNAYGTPRCAYCARSCLEPLFIGSPRASPPEGLVAVSVRLRAAFSPIPSNAVVFVKSAAGGGAATLSNHRVPFLWKFLFTWKVL